ncbi:MAG: hypothetical protein GEEBNDBF_01409 [bacterium]|nr:hypothetical protein [bacterium]
MATQPPPVPTRDLTLAAWEGAPTRAWLTLTQGSFLRGFLISHGVGNFALALIDNLPLMTLLVQPLATLGLARSEHLRLVTLRAVVLERLCFLLPILLVIGFHWTTIPTWCLVLLGCSYGAGAVALAAWMTWLAELTEQQPRGAFIARRSTYDSLVSIILGLGAAALLDWLLDHYGPTLGYLAIFTLAGFAGGGTLWLLAQIRTHPSQQFTAPQTDWHLLQRPLRSPDFRRYLRYILVLGVGQSISGPFWVVYMLQVLRWSFVEIALYGTLATLASLACYNWWGRLADRVGTIPLIRVITYARIINPVLWLFLTPENAWLILIPEAILTGVFIAGLVPLQLVYALKEASGEDRSAFLSLFHATQGLAALIGALLGGSLMTWTATLALPWGAGWTFMGFHLVFLLTSLARLLAPSLLLGMHEPDAVRVRDLWPLLRSSLRLNPTRPKAH